MAQDPNNIIITLLLGPSAEEVKIPLADFRRASQSLRNLVDQSTWTLPLHGENPVLVQYYIHYLLTGYVAFNTSDYKPVARLYVFADRFQDVPLKNECLDIIRKGVEDRDLELSDGQVINHIYGGTGGDNLGRKMLVDCVVAYGEENFLGRNVRWHSEFAVDLARELLLYRTRESTEAMVGKDYCE